MTVIKKNQDKGLKGSKLSKDKDFKEDLQASEEGGNRQAQNLRDN